MILALFLFNTVFCILNAIAALHCYLYNIPDGRMNAWVSGLCFGAAIVMGAKLT